MGGLGGRPLPLPKPGAPGDANRQHGRVGSGGDDGGDHDKVFGEVAVNDLRWRSTGGC